MNKKFFLILFLSLFLMGNAVAPFTLNSYQSNIIPLESINLQIQKEEIVFNIYDNEIEGNIKYEILNEDYDEKIGLIFPIYSLRENSFEIFFNNEKVNFEKVDLNYLKENLKDKYFKLKEIVSPKNLLFVDPITGNNYLPNYFDYIITSSNIDNYYPTFLKFVLDFKKNTENILFIKFKTYPNIDRKLYPKNVYSYYYILNTKDYFKDFKNINIKIFYPSNFSFTSNLKGNINKEENKILYEINLDKPNENLTFSYLNGKISKLSIYLYKKFPIMYDTYFIFIVIIFISLIIFVGLIIFLIIKLLKRKKK
ncbi:MAG: hypothetical protein ACPLWB_01630 [Caldisericia bacterium]